MRSRVSDGSRGEGVDEHGHAGRECSERLFVWQIQRIMSGAGARSLMIGRAGRRIAIGVRLRTKLSTVESAPVARPTPADRLSQRAPLIDSLRALACLLVIAAHAVTFAKFEPTQPLPWRVWLVGAVGVTLFFVISGYLVAGPFARAFLEHRAPPPTRPFILRRAARILPGWWIALAAALLVLRLRGLPLPGLGVLLPHVALVQIYLPQADSPLSVGWTLCVELIFYLSIPLLTAIAVRLWAWRNRSVDRLAVVLCAVWLGSIGSGIAQDLIQVPVRHNLLHYILASYVDFSTPARYLGLFVPGILAYVALSPNARRSRTLSLFELVGRHPAIAVAFSTLTLAATALAFQSTHTAIVDLAYPLVALPTGTLFILALTHGPAVGSWLRWPARVGVLTYGLYLYHDPVGLLLVHYGAGFSPGHLPVLDAVAGWFIPTVALLLFTLPFALFSWFCVERPLIRWAARRSKRAARLVEASGTPSKAVA